MRLSVCDAFNAKTKPITNRTKLIAHNITAVKLINRLANMQSMPSNRKINKGGRSNIQPKIIWFRLKLKMPFNTILFPSLEYLNQVFIQRARWFTNCSEWDVFS